MQLRIQLREGFRNDSVRILLAGREVFSKSDVTTDLPTSLADVVELSTDERRATLEVAIEGGASHREDIDVGDTPFVDVWVRDGSMEFRASSEVAPIM